MLDRCRDLAQHPNQPHPTAAEAFDEDGEGARAFYRRTHPSLAKGDKPLKGALFLVFSCSC